eukprot:SAG11_NODE_20271_length_449_cov_0.837143_1_plen_79_part_01
MIQSSPARGPARHRRLDKRDWTTLGGEWRRHKIKTRIFVCGYSVHAGLLGRHRAIWSIFWQYLIDRNCVGLRSARMRAS